MKLIVGLGNPGEKYALTRHNIGFVWLQQLAAELKVSFVSEVKFHGLCASGVYQGEPFRLLMPQTYMNASGMATASLCRFYQCNPEQILVIHDELDLSPGIIKLKLGGGSGGHNGLKDIITKIGSNDFWRLRIGIGHPGNRAAVVDYVLHPPSKEEASLIDEGISKSLTLWPLLLSGDYMATMQKLHSSQ
ncbi:MAG: aminoacyl-tRNA hydrolase [Nitrosomonas sp.]|nr:aminoacyl-tRNA hydrolase [Nitrosomonas sp.]MBK7363655.1 aminoacyl-tRNA hydrolase [Nitrosomonas sp.]